MAEGQQTPTFKLVLVGDGGTGKVSESLDTTGQECCPGVVPSSERVINTFYLQTTFVKRHLTGEFE